MSAKPIHFLSELPADFWMRRSVTPDVFHKPVEMESNAIFVATHFSSRLRLDRVELRHHWEWSVDRVEWNQF